MSAEAVGGERPRDARAGVAGDAVGGHGVCGGVGHVVRPQLQPLLLHRLDTCPERLDGITAYVWVYGQDLAGGTQGTARWGKGSYGSDKIREHT